MAEKKIKSAHKVQKLFELLTHTHSLLIVMQDNPDPDSLAGAAALRRLAHVLGEVKCSIAYGGVVGRAENRAMAEYLGLNFRSIDEIDFSEFDAVALVDTQPQTGNNSLPDDVRPDIVIDHHPLNAATRGAAFTDVRSKYGAVSTILYEYLCEAGITPGASLATALLYAIRTDTRDLGEQAVQADQRAVEALYPLANTRMLSAIQRGGVGRSYFESLAQALDNARTYGTSVVVADLGEVEYPDLMGEMADLFLRLEDVEWVLCWGFHVDQAWLSIRTSQSKVRAGDTMREIVEGLGTGGGHELSAGGQLPLEKGTRAERSTIGKTVRERFLNLTGAGESAARRLVNRDLLRRTGSA